MPAALRRRTGALLDRSPAVCLVLRYSARRLAAKLGGFCRRQRHNVAIGCADGKQPGAHYRRRGPLRGRNPAAHTVLVSSLDRPTFADATARRLWTILWQPRAPCDRAGACSTSRSVPLGAGAPAQCRALPRGTCAARRAAAAGSNNTTAEPPLDRAEIDGRLTGEGHGTECACGDVSRGAGSKCRPGAGGV